MKVIIAGSRRIPTMGLNEPQDWFKPGVQAAMLDLLEEVIQRSKFKISKVVSGGAWGIDSLGEVFAEKNKFPLIRMKADWSKGKKAGPVRNAEMAKVADALILVMSENSSGSDNMLNCMKKENKPYFAVIIGSKASGKW